MDQISLILVLLLIQSLIPINKSASLHDQDGMKKLAMLDKLLPELINSGALDMLNKIPMDRISDIDHDGNKEDKSPLETLLSSVQKYSTPPSPQNPLSSLVSLMSLMDPQTISPWSSILLLSNSLMSLATSTVKNTLTSDPDTYRTVPELLLSRGFSCDNHYVTTKDGTILHLFRIKSHFAQATLGNNSLHPVFLQHGFALSASSWLINSPGENVAPWVNKHKPLVTGNNLATFLANQGYDVWLGNNRGNQYSTNHTDMDAAHDDRFWKFSFDEHVEEDAPAMIDYILNITGKEKITVIGYSLGAAQLLGLLSVRPEYADHIDLFFALAPTAYLGHVKGPIGKFMENEIVHEIFQQFEGKFPPTDQEIPIKQTIMFFCNNKISKVFCATAFDYLAGLNTQQFNQSRLFVYLNHFEQVSSRIINHLLQIREKNVFHRYDFGETENLIKYNSKTAPKYPYSRIIFNKIVLISGLNDAIASPDDVHQLRKKLSGKIFIDYIVKNPKWNHLDFIFGKNGYENVNKFIAETIEKYSGKKLINHHN